MAKNVMAPAALGAVLLVTAGCTTRTLDVFEEPSNMVIVGAKSRHIATIDVDPKSPLGHVRPRKVICAEPSPDTVSAVAQSVTAAFQAAAQVQPSGGQAAGAGEAAAQFGKTVSEGLIQMTERTQTIQLLRDSLYRACEAYANGALSDTAYALILSRYDDTMVTMLTAELAAGAFGRTPGAISSEAQHTLKDLSNELKVAQERFQSAATSTQTGNGAATTGTTQANATPPAQGGVAQRIDIQQLPSLPASPPPQSTQAGATPAGAAPAAPSTVSPPSPAASTAPSSQPPSSAAPPAPPAQSGQPPPPAQQDAASKQLPSTSATASQPSTISMQQSAAPAGGGTAPPAQSAAEMERRAAASAQFAQAAGALMGAAKVTATAGGGLNPQPTPQLADKLIQLHERFTESGGREAFLVACLNALDRREGTSGLTERCKEYLKAVTKVASAELEINKAIENRIDVLKDRARYDFHIRYAQIRAGVLSDMVKFCSGNGQAPANSAQCNQLLLSVKDIFNAEYAAVDSRLTPR